MREKRKKKPLNVQIGLRTKECRLNGHMTQEHVSELPDVTRQYVSGLERGVTARLLEHSSTGAKSWIPAPTTFCWTNGQVRLGAQCPVQSVHRPPVQNPGYQHRLHSAGQTAKSRLGAQCPVQSVHRRAEGEDPGHHRRRRTVCETARAAKKPPP